MTTVLKHYDNGKYYVCLEMVMQNIDMTAFLEVTMSEMVGGILTYPERKMSYPYSELKKATATYNRYVREVKKKDA